MKAIIVLFLSSILIFLVGYNVTFNTKRTIAKNLSLARYSEDSKKYKRLTSDFYMHWAKISGVAIMVMALMFFTGFIVRAIEYFTLK
jgi:hypothetical protein